MSNERYFPGLEGVIAGETAISTVEGGLTYRGYTIEELARKHRVDPGDRRAWHSALQRELTSMESAAADLIHELTECDAEGDFEQAAIFDVAGELDRHRAAGATHTAIGIGLRAAGEDEGDRRE